MSAKFDDHPACLENKKNNSLKPPAIETMHLHPANVIGPRAPHFPAVVERF
jgi:hypothetical protein